MNSPPRRQKHLANAFLNRRRWKRGMNRVLPSVLRVNSDHLRIIPRANYAPRRSSGQRDMRAIRESALTRVAVGSIPGRTVTCLYGRMSIVMRRALELLLAGDVSSKRPSAEFVGPCSAVALPFDCLRFGNRRGNCRSVPL